MKGFVITTIELEDDNGLYTATMSDFQDKSNTGMCEALETLAGLCSAVAELMLGSRCNENLLDFCQHVIREFGDKDNGKDNTDIPDNIQAILYQIGKMPED
jgi:hypothetical protein